MNCTHHPDVEAASRCAGCSEPFCFNCLVEIRGHLYCGACKALTLEGRPLVEAVTTRCYIADEALKFALIGLICVPIIQPIAIYKAVQARREIEKNPLLTGSGKTIGTLIIAIGALCIWVLNIISEIADA